MEERQQYNGTGNGRTATEGGNQALLPQKKKVKLQW